MIRRATIDDVDAIVALGRRWLHESSLEDVTADNPSWAAKSAEMLIGADYARTFVSDDEGEITGIIGIVVLSLAGGLLVFASKRLARKWFANSVWVQGEEGGMILLNLR